MMLDLRAWPFELPLLLALAIALPVALVLLLIVAQRRRRARLARLGAPAMVARLVPTSALRGVWPRVALLGPAALLLGVALAGPRGGAEKTVVHTEGVDAVYAVDASLSMMATDEAPNRLERVKQEIRRLRAASPGDRVALLAFAGRSYILTPLTADDGALSLFLDNLNPNVVGQAGSSLARAIRQGTELLQAGQGGSDRALVVFSDGEAFEPEADVTAAAKEAADAGVALVTVGFGTEKGATIPIEGRNGAPDVKRDDAGAVVVTRYNPTLLQAAATAARGTFVAATETDKAARIRAALGRLRSVQRALDAGRDQTPRFQLFLLPALLLLAADSVLSARRRRAPRRAAASEPARVAAALLVLALLIPHAARADAVSDAARAYRAKQYGRAAALYRQAMTSGDRSLETLYNYGTALLAADSLGAAVEPLERAAAAREPELAYRAQFNLGLAHLKTGLKLTGDSAQAPLAAALGAYKKVLLMRPADADAKWNFELALRKKKSGGGGGGGGQGGGQQPSPSKPQASAERPAGDLGKQQAQEILNSAARDERDVQGKHQDQNRPTPPPGGKDW